MKIKNLIRQTEEAMEETRNVLRNLELLAMQQKDKTNDDNMVQELIDLLKNWNHKNRLAKYRLLKD